MVWVRLLCILVNPTIEKKHITSNRTRYEYVLHCAYSLQHVYIPYLGFTSNYQVHLRTVHTGEGFEYVTGPTRGWERRFKKCSRLEHCCRAVALRHPFLAREYVCVQNLHVLVMAS